MKTDTIADLPGEEWREVAESEGQYFVSNMGRVKSFKRASAALLKPTTNGFNYWQVNLRIAGGRRCFLVHRLVMLAFKPIDNLGGFEVNHIDLNTANCALSNLEWVTSTQNKAHSFAVHGAWPDKTKLIGTNHHLNRVTEEQVLEIRRLCLTKKRGILVAVAKQFDINPGTVAQIVSRKTWKHLPPECA